MKALLRSIRSLLARSDAGQTMIFFAVVSPVLLGTMGVAVEGGRAMLQYRQMQSAADMAALVGAQDLPCGSSDTTCITRAETDACTYAQNNGITGCVAGGASTPAANVPPVSCSPYDFIDYGNAPSNSNCKADSLGLTSTPSQYYYIEVRLTQTAVTVPIFNVNLNVYTHAVARSNVPTPTDFALIALSPNAGSLILSGTATAELGGSVFSNGSITVNGNAGSYLTCDGNWNTAATETAPPQLQSDASGQQAFAPTGCTGGNVGAAVWQSQQPPIQDPYANSSPPPASLVNCSICTLPGWYYQWRSSRSSGTWHQATSGISLSNGDNAELFPGTYQGIDWRNGSNIYLNPGVYTMQGNLTSRGGAICIYGAPACDEGESPANPGLSGSTNCSNASFLSSSSTYVSSDSWYYNCSPWGIWDSTLASQQNLTQPMFFDSSTGASSTTPMNGVTFYIQSGNVDMNGNGVLEFLTYPNPCAGTGSQNGQSPFIPWTSGANPGDYKYPSGSIPNGDGITDSSSVSASAVYPSADLTVKGQCKSTLEAWSGEFANPEQPQFLFWTRNASTSITLNGGGRQNMMGIMYAPSSTVSMVGNSGASGGPPWLYGQVVSYVTSLGGTTGTTIDFRPCTGGTTPCVTGVGTSLVE